MLGPQDLADIRAALTAEKARLLAQAEADREFGVAQEPTRGDSADESAHESLVSERMRMATRAQGRLAEVEAALRRLTEGGFGACAECDEPISPRRLRARPTTRLCLPCQEDAEREQRQSRDAVGDAGPDGGLGLGVRAHPDDDA